MKKVLITGASGFIGQALCIHLQMQGYNVVGTVRNRSKQVGLHQLGIPSIIIPDINASTDWLAAFEGIDLIIHTAARVHVEADNVPDTLGVYFETNTLATERIVVQASEMKVKQFIFLSTINIYVNDDSYSYNHYYIHEGLEKNPSEPYGISKLAAENRIQELCKKKKLKYSILRLPLVYGSIQKGNFPSLLKIVKKGIPLPFGLMRKERSFLYIGNLNDAISVLVKQPGNTCKSYFVTDADDISLSTLIRLIAKAYKIRIMLVPVPYILLKLLGQLIRKTKKINRLTCAIQVDSSAIRKDLNWLPPYTVETALREMAQQDRDHQYIS